MVTIHDKGSDNVRLRSGSGHMMTKKTSIWVLMCKEKRMKNSGESDFCHMCTLLYHNISFSSHYIWFSITIVFLSRCPLGQWHLP